MMSDEDTTNENKWVATWCWGQVLQGPVPHVCKALHRWDSSLQAGKSSRDNRFSTRMIVPKQCFHLAVRHRFRDWEAVPIEHSWVLLEEISRMDRTMDWGVLHTPSCNHPVIWANGLRHEFFGQNSPWSAVQWTQVNTFASVPWKSYV